MPTGPDEGFLEGLYQAFRSRAEGLAPMFQPGYDATEMDGDDIETVWNRRSMSLEDEWKLHQAKNPDGSPMYSRELIGSMVFKDREGLIRSGGRVEPKEWIAFANTTAKRMAAKREARAAAMSPLTAPAYDPMEGV
jgi:hypothetical protein